MKNQEQQINRFADEIVREDVKNRVSAEDAEAFGCLSGADGKEICQYWQVSPWLGYKLKEKGEIVVDYFLASLWGRTTEGQSVAQDTVIQDIAENLLNLNETMFSKEF